MKPGIEKGSEPQISAKDVGTSLLKIMGVGLAAGVALVAATDKIMKKVTSSKKEEE